MTSTSLFGKLQEHELGRLEQHENQAKKSKSISLKVESKIDQSDDAPEEDENFMLLVKGLGKFFGKNDKTFNHSRRNNNFKKKETSTSTQEVTCYECGKQGHIKPDRPKISKKGGFKGKKESKNKRAYVAWEDNDISSSSESESDESAHLALMESHHSDDESYEVSNEFTLYDNDAQGAINELLNECKVLYKTISSQKKHISSLEEKVEKIEKDFEDEKQKMISDQEQNFVCKTCDSLKGQMVQLKRVIKRYEKGEIGLKEIFRRRNFSNDKNGLGYSKFDKPRISKTIFVKANEQPRKDQSRKFQPRRNKPNNPQCGHPFQRSKNAKLKKIYVPRYKRNFKPTCSYCGMKGHNLNACYVRTYGVASGHYAWVKKGEKYEGPKATWVPNKS